MKEITMTELMEIGTELFGEDNESWRFVCPSCNRVQSAKSVREQMAQGAGSKRYGMLEKGDSLHVEQACFSPECDWIANGLFSGPILVIIDPDKPHNAARNENCTHIFAMEGMSLE